LFVACKQEDTLKKLREILLAGYAVRHPNGPEINPESQVIHIHFPLEHGINKADFRRTEEKDHYLRKTCSRDGVI
jgi:hypothetical protein